MRLKYQFETMEMDDEVVAVPVGDGAEEFHGILRLNESALSILHLLEQDTTADAVVEGLLREYEGDRDEIAGFVAEYVQNLREEGLLIE